jgi:hypothetical protein
MKSIIVLKPFKFAHEGIRVEEFAPDEVDKNKVIEVSDECAEVALTEKWAKPAREPRGRKEPEQAAQQQAPETAAQTEAPETKAEGNGEVGQADQPE